MTWFKDVFGHEKVVIASLYLPPLPGSPDYVTGSALADIIAYTSNEVRALERGGMDGIIFGNQRDWPYRVGVGPETVALMTLVIREATRDCRVPFGISIFWDDLAAIAIAKATGAAFVRGVFSGVYAGEMGLLSLNAGDALRYRQTIDATSVRLMFMLRPILAKAVGERDLKSQVKDALWSSKPDAFALCGPVPGEAPAFAELQMISALAKNLPVLMNNGATPENIDQVFANSNGAVVATHLRQDNNPNRPFDVEKVRSFMARVNQARAHLH